MWTARGRLASHMYPWSLQLRAVEAANAQAAAKTRRDFDARLVEQQAANEEDLDERLSAATKRVLQHNRSLQQELRLHTEVKRVVLMCFSQLSLLGARMGGLQQEAACQSRCRALCASLAVVLAPVLEGRESALGCRVSSAGWFVQVLALWRPQHIRH